MASHASNSKSALSPARQRISSTSQRARPTPGTGSGVDGSAENSPARSSGCRLAEIGCFCLPPPTAKRDADRPRPFRSELEPARGPRRRGGGGRAPAHDRLAAQAFFKAGEDGLLVAAFEIDDAVGVQPGLRERRRKQVQSG